MRKAQSMTVVVPFYNEEQGLCFFYQALIEQLEQLEITYDLIFVDDGSSDRTLLELNQLADQDPCISILSFSRNFGHQIALTAGLDFANGEVVVVMDSDLQHPPAVIPLMLAEYEQGYDVVYAVRNEAENLGVFKRVTASLYYRLLRRISSIQVIAGAADFRLMAQPVVLSLRQMREMHRYLRGMVPWLGFPSTKVQYDQPDRFAGQPGYTFRKSFRMARDGLFSFSTVPLEIITWTGLILTGLGFLYLIYILITAFAGRAIVGWSSLIGTTLIIGGFQLLAIGVLAQYIGMIFEQIKERPLYVLKQSRLSSQQTAVGTKHGE